MPKNIVIFSDGTGQAGGINFDEARTNISCTAPAAWAPIPALILPNRLPSTTPTSAPPRERQHSAAAICGGTQDRLAPARDNIALLNTVLSP
jgi:hypothetical protein